MAVTPKLRLVIEFLNPNAEYRFKQFYKQQELKLDLGNCEIFPAHLVSMEEYTPPREFIEECTTITAAMATALSERFRSVYQGLSSSNKGGISKHHPYLDCRAH